MIDLKMLNAQEMEKIEEFRERMGADYPQDLEDHRRLLYRFLKARDFNLDKAEKMLRKHLAWRKANQVDNILKEFTPKQFYLEYIQPSCLGYDKDGDIILYSPTGKIDTRDILKCITINNLMRHWIWYFEKMRNFRKRYHDKEKDLQLQCHIIFNLDEITFSNAASKETMDFLIRFLHILQDNYPEDMKCVDVINAPSYFVLLWSSIKIFLSNATLQKIKIYGQSGWQDRLLESIDRNELPAFMGGTRTDPDGNPQCKTFVGQGGKIAPIYYITNDDRDFRDRSNVKKVTVPPSSVKEVYVDVQEQGSIILWEILIQGKDIGFGLFYKGMNEMEEILPLQRINTLDGVDRNYYTAKLIGKYVFIFDNNHSWLTTKEIEYYITVKQENRFCSILNEAE